MCPRERRNHVCVVVLGDFGRSPRMQYHTLSLANHDFDVDVVAYRGSDPLDEIKQKPNVNICYIKDTPKFEKCLPSILVYILKTLWQSFFLFFTLIQICKVDSILVQNPPSIPTLPVCYFVSLLKGCSLFVDYHNYGYTILSLSLGQHHFLVKLSKWCEKYFGAKAHKNICVTKAMKEDLMSNWKIRASVFYDCAPKMFHPISLKEKHSFFMKMCEEHEQFKDRSESNESNRFTKQIGDDYILHSDRPALVISSTSWTEDEDFSILLSALEDYELVAKSSDYLPDLVVAITGKGPLKSYYESQIRKKRFSHIEIMTLWLKSEDYPTFLACADLGVSLHSSSSGLDLPMKVVDMLGSHLPVCALSFNCIDELVMDGTNGLIFSNSLQLSRQIQELFDHFPNKSSRLKTFREDLTNFSPLKWEENWDCSVYPLFTET